MSIIIFIVILVILILVHEFGHFIVAKKTGIRVDEFSIGFFKPKLFSKKIGETEYSFRPLLLGGYVKIFGEDPDEESRTGPDSARSFVNKPKWVQAMVLVAGVGFNILLAWFLFSVVFMMGMPTVVDSDESYKVNNPRLTIVTVFPDSPADQADLRSGDELMALSTVNENINELTTDSVADFISLNGDEKITVQYRRGDVVMTTDVFATQNLLPDIPDTFAIGISMGTVGELKFSPPVAVWEGGKFTLKMLSTVAVALVGFFASIFTFSADLSQVAGPIGIVGLVGDAAELGLVSLLFFTAIISLNLAIINILPIPALDGGRLLFVIIEALKGSPMNPRVVNTLNIVFFYLLIFLIFVISYNDVVRLF